MAAGGGETKEEELKRLRQRVAELEEELEVERTHRAASEGFPGEGAAEGGGYVVGESGDVAEVDGKRGDGAMEDAEVVRRFSRQMLVSGFGWERQQRLRSGSCLVIGCGGLGCPAALYLAAAGVGRIGLVDADAVEASNLHRQIGHSLESVGVRKVASLGARLRSLGGATLVVEEHDLRFDAPNGEALARRYDVVLDCSDNPRTRYLASDACVLAGRPLVFGAALGQDGQVAVFCGGGAAPSVPCYRCVFPRPPPPAAVGSCGDNGVLGPVTGVVGSLQALEALKLLAPGPWVRGSLAGRLLAIDAAAVRFHVVQLRPRRSDCPACGTAPSLHTLLDAGERCAADGLCEAVEGSAHARRFDDDLEVSIDALASRRASDASAYLHDDPAGTGTAEEDATTVVLDVRVDEQWSLCRLPRTLHVPLELIERAIRKGHDLPPQIPRDKTLLCLCRRGVRSLRAAELFRTVGLPAKSVHGGLNAFRSHIDPSFPLY